jgi:O-antigen chain-terminating methyltransferase
MRLARRIVLSTVGPELDSLGQDLGRLDQGTARLDQGMARLDQGMATLAHDLARRQQERETLEQRFSETEAAGAALAADVQRESAALQDLQRHLETRLDQTLGVIEDVRSAYLATRGEFEQARDQTIPELSARLDRMSETVGTIQREVEAVRDRALPELSARLDRMSETAGTIQREVEAVRDRALPELSARVDRMSETAGTIQREVEAVRDRRLPQSEQALARLQGSSEVIQKELESLRDGHVPHVEKDLLRLQNASEAQQRELESLRDEHVPRVEKDLLSLQGAVEALQKVMGAIQALGEELRDARLPALAARTDALVDALHEDLTALGGLVERIAQDEPLKVSVEPAVEAEVPRAIAAASRRFVDSFRGQRAEILGRVADYVPWLAGAGPVLDLGCGRGELLEALRDAGVEAQGVDSDPAMVAACRRLGLSADVGDALATLRDRTPGNLGAVTCIHVFEHLQAATWMSVVEAAAAALRSGGLLLVECPNPDSLRVGAGLFWMDPTHRVPVHPQALEFVMKALGLKVVEKQLLRPFPPEQALAKPSQPEAVRELAGRLDAWLSGPRDFVVLARKP